MPDLGLAPAKKRPNAAMYDDLKIKGGVQGSTNAATGGFVPQQLPSGQPNYPAIGTMPQTQTGDVASAIASGAGRLWSQGVHGGNAFGGHGVPLGSPAMGSMPNTTTQDVVGSLYGIFGKPNFDPRGSGRAAALTPPTPSQPSHGASGSWTETPQAGTPPTGPTYPISLPVPPGSAPGSGSGGLPSPFQAPASPVTPPTVSAPPINPALTGGMAMGHPGAAAIGPAAQQQVEQAAQGQVLARNPGLANLRDRNSAYQPPPPYVSPFSGVNPDDKQAADLYKQTGVMSPFTVGGAFGTATPNGSQGNMSLGGSQGGRLPDSQMLGIAGGTRPTGGFFKNLPPAVGSNDRGAVYDSKEKARVVTDSEKKMAKELFDKGYESRHGTLDERRSAYAERFKQREADQTRRAQGAEPDINKRLATVKQKASDKRESRRLDNGMMTFDQRLAAANPAAAQQARAVKSQFDAQQLNLAENRKFQGSEGDKNRASREAIARDNAIAGAARGGVPSPFAEPVKPTLHSDDTLRNMQPAEAYDHLVTVGKVDPAEAANRVNQLHGLNHNWIKEPNGPGLFGELPMNPALTNPGQIPAARRASMGGGMGLPPAGKNQRSKKPTREDLLAGVRHMEPK